jgi:hypothetical protein
MGTVWKIVQALGLVLLGALLTWAPAALRPSAHMQATAPQIVKFVVETEAPTTWMIVRVSQMNASPDALIWTRQTALMTVRPWSYTVEMHDDMYVAVTPSLFSGDTAQDPGKGSCHVEVNGVEVPNSRVQFPGQCTYQIV